MPVIWSIPRQFVCIEDTESGRLAGYINFIPCTKALYEDIRYQSEHIRDDDIRPQELEPLKQTGNDLFIISIALHPDFKDTDAIRDPSNGWIDYLNRLETSGYPITSITATAVSPDGRKALHRMQFEQERILREDGNIVYVCEGQNLQKLKKRNYDYMANYENDIYLMLPLADNQKNWRLDELGVLKQASLDKQTAYASVADDFSRSLLNNLQSYLEYECNNVVVDELRMAYLGQYEFLHSTDDYPKHGEDPEVVGTSTCQLILTAHQPTHMYILTVVLPKDTVKDFSTTQVLDQLSHESLCIACPKDAGQYLGINTKKYTAIPDYVDLYDYLKYKYGLLKCGSGKAFLLLSDRPEKEDEFRCMMAGETYDSQHQDFHIASDNISQICQTNHAQYDYYQVYMSEMVVACIMENFSENMEERIDITATYAFIVILAMFQNTSIEKVNMQISNALANDGDISHQEILGLYRNFGKTVRFWEKNNYKYWGHNRKPSVSWKPLAIKN